MDSNKIDEIMGCLRNFSRETEVINLLNIDTNGISERNYFKKHKDFIYRTFMREIDKENFEYFYSTYSKTDDFETKSVFNKLLQNTSKKEYIKDYLETEREESEELASFDALDLMKAVDDPKYIKINIDKYLKKFKMDGLEISTMIGLAKDPELISSIVADNRKQRHYKLDKLLVYNLIIQSKNSELIKSVLKDRKTVRKLQLDKVQIKDLLSVIDDEKTVVDLIENLDEFGLDKADILHLVATKTSHEYQDKFLKTRESQTKENDKLRKIDLPEDMTVGIEIESEGEVSEIIMNSNIEKESGWESKGDGSLHDGVEVVSPVLSGNNENRTQEVKKICKRLNRLRTNKF